MRLPAVGVRALVFIAGKSVDKAYRTVDKADAEIHSDREKRSVKEFFSVLSSAINKCCYSLISCFSIIIIILHVPTISF